MSRASVKQKRKVSLVSRLLSLPVRHLQQALGSLGDLWRTPFTSVMTVLVLGISLALPATLHLFVKNANVVTEQWHSASQISLFLKTSVTDKAAKNLVQRLNLFPEIDDVQYISADQALTDFKALSGFGQALDYLDNNPLPATIIITPTQRASQSQAAQELLAKLEQQREVDQGKLDLEWLTRLQAIAELAKDIVIGVALLLCLSVVLIISNTIRLAILNQKDAIAVMKLVGATDSFIQRPFLYSGAWYGILGGLFSGITVSLLAYFLAGSVKKITDLYQSSFTLQGLSASEYLLLILFAVFLGLMGSYLSVRKHIRAIEPTAD